MHPPPDAVRRPEQIVAQHNARIGLRPTVGVSAMSAITSSDGTSGHWVPSERYPDPSVQVLDPSFAKYRLLLAGVERLATGMRWCEGPVYFGDARCLLWSDIPNNRMLRWDEETGRISVFRKPSNNANGNTRDRQGRLITCEMTLHVGLSPWT